MSDAHSGRRISGAGILAWLLVVVLAVLHYDFWYWDDRTLVFGFVPIGLLFQVLISVGAATAWLLVVKFAWPSHIEEWASESDDSGNSSGSGGNE